jgi:peptide/nickel transport system substrate-binding protein
MLYKRKRKIHRIAAAGIAALLLTALVSACTPPGAAPSATPTDTERSVLQTAVPQRGGELVCGVRAQPRGDLGNGWWGQNDTDDMVRGLIDNASTVAVSYGGEVLLNSTVCAYVTYEHNEDLSKTFTFRLNEGLVFNNGEPITAASYAAYALVAFSPEARAAGALTESSASRIVGAQEYMSGEASYISGIRLLDEYTFSVTIRGEYLPYYHELVYAALSPLYLPMYTPSASLSVRDGGQGVYLDGGSLVPDELNAARTIYSGRVSAGAYSITGFDGDTYTLTQNERYLGNFEGKTGYIEELSVKKIDMNSAAELLLSGEVDIVPELRGAEIAATESLTETREFAASTYPRSGYGELVLSCDFGPTRFKAVRQALAYLIDRDAVAAACTDGYFATVLAPYAIDSWMYREGGGLLIPELEAYGLNPQRAAAMIEQDGWILDENGGQYYSGVRWKSVTDEEADGDARCVRLWDGRILMPLIIDWAASQNVAASEAMTEYLTESEEILQAGMQIERTVLPLQDFLDYLFRHEYTDPKFGEKTYGIYNLGVTLPPVFDQAYFYSKNPVYIAQDFNESRADNDLLDRLSSELVYTVEAGDRAEFLAAWIRYLDEWNDYLPQIPLYVNLYRTVYSAKLEGYEQNAFRDFAEAILYAHMAE